MLPPDQHAAAWKELSIYVKELYTARFGLEAWYRDVVITDYSGIDMYKVALTELLDSAK